MHTLLRNYMLAHMKGVLVKFQATAEISHGGEKGAAREALSSTAISPWFGPGVSIGTGLVIDRNGETSKQSDNVLYWPDV